MALSCRSGTMSTGNKNYSQVPIGTWLVPAFELSPSVCCTTSFHCSPSVLITTMLWWRLTLCVWHQHLSKWVKHYPTLFIKRVLLVWPPCFTMLDDVLWSLISVKHSVKYRRTFLLFPSLMNNVWFVWAACKTLFDSCTCTSLSLIIIWLNFSSRILIVYNVL